MQPAFQEFISADLEPADAKVKTVDNTIPESGQIDNLYEVISNRSGYEKVMLNVSPDSSTTKWSFTAEAQRQRGEENCFLCVNSAFLYVRQAASLSLLRAKNCCFPAARGESLRQAGSLPDNAVPLRLGAE